MTWPLYMDHHVPWPVTAALRQRGYNVLTAAEDQAAERDDEILLDRATQQGRIFVTQDRDLLSLAELWRKEQKAILWHCLFMAAAAELFRVDRMARACRLGAE